MPTTTRHPIETINRYQPENREPGRLSRQHHQVLVLDSEGKKYAEIAEAMGRPLGTIRSSLHRAKAALNKLVTADVVDATASLTQAPPL